MMRVGQTSPLDDLRLVRPPVRRFWSHAVLFAACLLLGNGLFGERGLTETLRASATSVRIATRSTVGPPAIVTPLQA